MGTVPFLLVKFLFSSMDCGFFLSLEYESDLLLFVGESKE